MTGDKGMPKSSGSVASPLMRDALGSAGLKTAALQGELWYRSFSLSAAHQMTVQADLCFPRSIHSLDVFCS